MSESDQPAFWSFASTPPMGWNSWDCFGATIREDQVREQAAILADKLLPYGWDTLTVDIQWYEPNAQGHDYKEGAPLTLDPFGRPQPAENRFPSAAGGGGFAPLAAYVHGLGLKFGVHIMRGIPRQAVLENLPVFGTDFRARDIANVNSVCAWNPDNYGVDMSRPGAQAFYDGELQMLADWGVDFVKVDDLSRPYFDNLAEIEAIRKAIDRTGRPMTLSLSPGETAIEAGEHVARHANMWRISDDFWDSWQHLFDQFERLNSWSRFSGPGHFPDGDMLPLGRIRFGEPTKLTAEEQRTMMSLWAIARSPLILGCDLTSLDNATLELITNRDVIRVNQQGLGAAQLRRSGDEVVWKGASPQENETFVAVFNLGESAKKISCPLADLGVSSNAIAKELWSGEPFSFESGILTLDVPGHGSRLLSLLAEAG